MYPGSLVYNISLLLNFFSLSLAQVPGTAPFAFIRKVDVSATITFTDSARSTGNVTVTFSGSMVRAAVGLWVITGLKSVTPVDVAQSNTLSASIDVVAGGVAAAIGYNHSPSTQSWTGLNKDFQETISDNDNAGIGGASLQVVANQSNRSVALNASTKQLPAMCVVSFR